jgi:formimidoylglutamate deiminase
VEWERPRKLFARRALTGDGWQRDVLFTLTGGLIAAVDAGVQSDGECLVFDLLLPGVANVHSHAFQRAMAGLTEAASPKKDDNFWTWREVMYAFACALTSEQVQVIAEALYIQFLRHGYTAVGEFHYVHHDGAGHPYEPITELSDRIIGASQKAGIHLTHLPVLYETSDFGGVAPTPRQRRFVQTPEDYLKMLESLLKKYAGTEDLAFGFAPHSLRATKPASIRAVLAALPSLGLADCPIHIHVAEQEKEVNDCVAWSGQRPLDWLLRNVEVGPRWCLIHATHSTPKEIAGIIGSGAAVGLCPSTEANLGDGIFPAAAFVEGGGRFGIGTDSNVCVSPWEELRLLESAQRLTLRRRAILSDEACPSVGRTLCDRVANGGAAALGLRCGVLAVGYRADIVALSMDDALLAGREADRILDSLVFAGIRPKITDVFVGGKRVIQDGRHRCEESSEKAFRDVMHTLCAAI